MCTPIQFGYLSFHGTMHHSIAIRTGMVHDGRLNFSVDGGFFPQNLARVPADNTSVL
nr:hypothetical protein [uncultured Desulfobacter sp.]